MFIVEIVSKVLRSLLKRPRAQGSPTRRDEIAKRSQIRVSAGSGHGVNLIDHGMHTQFFRKTQPLWNYHVVKSFWHRSVSLHC